MKRVTSIITLLLVLSLVLVSLGGKVQIINGKDSLAPATIQDEHFIVQKVLYVFHGYELLCSFNAKSGYWVELNILSTGDYPYEVILEITSANHGLIFNARAYGSVEVSNFTQIVNLNYDDSYNITVAKHPFYSTVKISGTIDLYHNETTNLTPSLYIRADGSVEGTDNIQREGNVYIFTDNINGEIVVERNNIVVDGAGYTLEGGSGREISLTNRTNVTIKSLRIASFQSGVFFIMSKNNTIINCTIINNGIEHRGEGISFVLGSSNNIISHNNITGNYFGIRCFLSPSNIISENFFTKNKAYALLLDSVDITVFHNNITDNNIGIVISGRNIVYNNNFIDNIVHAICDPSVTNSTWDNGYSGGGNYWSNYNGTDANSDGIGDTPYVIYKSNQDNYPVVNIIPEFPSWTPMLLILAVLAVVLTIYKRKLQKASIQSNQE